MSKNHEIEQRAVIRYLMRKNKTGKNKSPYSPDLAPSDFHVFRKMKMDLKGKRFSSDDDVKAAVMAWLDSQPLTFWESGIERCKDRWLSCFNLDGDYVEK